MLLLKQEYSHDSIRDWIITFIITSIASEKQWLKIHVYICYNYNLPVVRIKVILLQLDSCHMEFDNINV